MYQAQTCVSILNWTMQHQCLSDLCLHPQILDKLWENLKHLNNPKVQQHINLPLPHFLGSYERTLEFLQREFNQESPKPNDVLTVRVTATNIYEDLEQLEILVHQDEPDPKPDITKVGEEVDWSDTGVLGQTAMQFQVRNDLKHRPRASILLLCSLALSLARNSHLDLEVEIVNNTDYFM